MKQLTRVLSITLTLVMLLTVFPMNVWAAQLKIKDMDVENGESVCTLTITRDNNGLIKMKDINFTYSINGEPQKPLDILSLEREHKVIVITAPAFQPTDFEQTITITETNENKSVTLSIPAEQSAELLELQPRMFYVYDQFGYFDGDLTGTKPALADEQDKILAAPPYSADPYLPPIDSERANNANTWRTPGGNWTADTATAVLNLLRECRIDQIWFYDGPIYAPSTYTEDGSAPYEVMKGTLKIFNGDQELISYDITNEGKWVKVDLDDSIVTNALRFVKEQDLENNRYSWSGGGWTSSKGEYVCDVNIPEIALYGESLGEIPPEETEEEWPGLTPSDKEPVKYDYTMGEFIGTNGFFTDALGNYDSIGFVREYHHWGWTEWAAGDRTAPDGSKNLTGIEAEPQTAFIDGWGFDNYYKRLKDEGVGVNICVQGGVSNVPEGMTARPNYQGNRDKYNASSYLAHGQSMFQLAARYGSNPNVDPSLIRVAPGTEKKVGLDYIKYYENWNEPNLVSFKNDGAAFAAMTSADYDGHMGTMGPDVGIKQADPDARFVFGGLAGTIFETFDDPEKEWTPLEFFEQAIEWFDNNRTEEQWLETHDSLEGYVKYPFDVISCHYYSPDGHAPTGLSAEDDHVYRRMSEFKDFRDTYFPEVELWLSEFGWDSTQGSPQSATVEYTDANTGVLKNEGINVGLTGKEVQGRWLVRKNLILATTGLDRVQQFMMPNSGNGEGSSGRFETCGLIEGTQESTNRKPSWYYIGTMKNYLDTTKFDSIIVNGKEADPWVLKFKEMEDNGTDSIFAAWLPTSKGDMNGTNVVNYELTLPEGTEYAYLIELMDKSLEGEHSELAIVDGKVMIPISESPVFVLARETELVFPDKFEGKPSSEENDFLFDNEFDIAGSSYTTYGGTFTVVDGRNANGTDGKILKVVGTNAGPEFKIPADALQAMEYDKWYYVDYKFMMEDTNSAPKLALLDSWSPIYSPSGGGNLFKPQWSGDSGRVAVTPNEWHRLKAKIKINSINNRISYEVFYDDVSIGKADTTIVQALPLNGLLIQMVADPSTNRSTYYLDDVWVYTPKPKTLLLDGTLDDMSLGNLVTGNGFTIESGYKQSTVMEPESEDDYFLGTGDRLLQVKQDGYIFNTVDTGILEEIRIGQPYVFEFSFYTTSERTAPTIQLLYDGWKRHSIANTNWHGGIAVATSNLVDRLPAVSIAPVPQQWHRIAVKYKFITATQLKYSLYYDGNAIATDILLDSAIGDASKPNSAEDPTRQMEFLSDNLAAGMGFLVGSTISNPDADYALYYNDIFINQSDSIKAWPDKY